MPCPMIYAHPPRAASALLHLGTVMFFSRCFPHMVCARAARLTLVGCTHSVSPCLGLGLIEERPKSHTWQRSLAGRSCGRARVCDDARAVACAPRCALEKE